MIIINREEAKNFVIKNIDIMVNSRFTKNEPYCLYAYMSHQFNGCNIFDVGTYKGNSATALADNKRNFVYSFNIIDQRVAQKVKNANYIIDDFRLWLGLKPKLVLIDVALHDGILEKEMLDNLGNCIILFDDIRLNNGMKIFWENIGYEKYDLTNIGHWSGTGLVNLTDEEIKII